MTLEKSSVQCTHGLGFRCPTCWPIGLCPRTLALYKPGVPMPGVNHHYVATGKMPQTGRIACHLCGQDKPGSQPAMRDMQTVNPRA